LIAAWSFITKRKTLERYRSGHNGTDSKSVEGLTALRGFESLPLRHIPTEDVGFPLEINSYPTTYLSTSEVLGK
jgi:hypothetical protein